MPRFDTYLFKNLFIACVFITVVLTAVVFLTQSLRLLELIIESGASSGSFWVLTFLALPRFFEVIVPLAMMAAVIFIYNKMILDSEMVAIRAGGKSPFQIARSAILLSIILSLFLYAMTLFAAPKALDSMKKMQQVLKAQFSILVFQDGIFNQAGKGLTVYIRNRTGDGQMEGVMIHDSRADVPNPSTILAKRGQILSGPEGYKVIVYEGSRQEFDRKKNILQKLDFERYTIDLPDSSPVRMRWAEPNERTIIELMNPNPDNKRDMESLRDFKVEIHKRLTSPLLVINFALIAISCLLLGPQDRKGQAKRIMAAIIMVILIQGLYLSSYNIARQSDIGFIFMYLLTFAPILFCSFLISQLAEPFRRSFLYKRKPLHELPQDLKPGNMGAIK